MGVCDLHWHSGQRQIRLLKVRFADTHVRINRDILKARHRERRSFELCLETGQSCVIDNTNPIATDRAALIAPAKTCAFRIIGYFFEVPVKDALARSASSSGKARIPVFGVLRTAKILQRPKFGEGFDEHYQVAVTNAPPSRSWEITTAGPAFVEPPSHSLFAPLGVPGSNRDGELAGNNWEAPREVNAERETQRPQSSVAPRSGKRQWEARMSNDTA